VVIDPAKPDRETSVLLSMSSKRWIGAAGSTAYLLLLLGIEEDT
jgi:hypothetical protein